MLTRFLSRVRFVLTSPKKAIAILRRPVFKDAPVAPGIVVKQYPTHAAYVAHQQEKLASHSTEWLADYDRRYRTVLAERLPALGVIKRGDRVLCLAARLGGEVRACRDVGAFAVGIDLNPGKDNHYVLYGDFHQIDLADGVVDLVFTNSLDHALDFPRLFSEIRRVLTPTGYFVTEIVKGSAEGVVLGYYDVATWDEVSTVVAICEEAGFTVRSRAEIDFPGGRECVVFQPRPL